MRVLFLSPWFPYPPHNGSKIRAFYLLRALAEAGHRVSLFSFVRPGEVADPSGLVALCDTWITAPWNEFRPTSLRAILGYLSPKPRSVASTYSRRVEEALRDLACNVKPDIVIAAESATAEYAKSLPYPRILEDLDELPVMREAASNVANRAVRLLRYLTWWKYRSYIRHIIWYFSRTTLVSEFDRNLLREIVPAYRCAVVIPNGIDVQWNHPQWTPTVGRLVYNGSLTYSANYDAIAYFLSNVWPLIRAQEPSVELWITGSTEGVPLHRLPADGQVHFTGYLEDVRPAVGGAWACIVPLRIGGGTRLKILEAMALGTPVISTTKGAQGLDVVPEEHLLVADTPEDFAAQTVRLLRDPLLRRRLAENARRLVEDKYDWRHIGRRFIALVEEAVGTAHDGSPNP